MSAAVSFDTNNGQLVLSGDLTFSTVTQCLKETESIFKTVEPLTIDFAQVAKSDSAGLALLIHWLRLAKKQQKSLTFQHIPAQMLALADASGLEDILPFAAVTV